MKHFFMLAAALAAPCAFATVGTCTGGVTLNNYLPSDLQTGCTYINASFSNFAVNTVTGGPTIPASSMTFTSSPTVGDTLNSLNGLAVPDFSSALFTGSPGNQNQNDFAYVMEAHTGGTIGGYSYTNGNDGYVSPAGAPWQIRTITLDYSHALSTGAAGEAFLFITMDFCLGDTTRSTTGVCEEDVGADAGRISLQLQSSGSGGVFVSGTCFFANHGSSCGSNGFSSVAGKVTFTVPFAGVQAVSILDTFAAVSLGGAGDTITLTDYVNTFGVQSVTPEPSTFALVGVAIGGLLWTRRRRAHARS